MGTLNVIAVAMRSDTFRWARSLLDAVGRYDDQIAVFCVPRVTDEDLATSDLILLDGRAPLRELKPLSTCEFVSPRSRVVIDLRICTARDLWNAGRNPGPPLLAIGTPEADAEARADLKWLLYNGPVYDLVREVIGDTLSEAQKSLLLEIIRRADRDTPTAIAREMFVSLRTLRRHCRRLDLRSPQRLQCVARVLRGVRWMIRSRGGLARAARIAGYSEPATFGRASRQCFGSSPSQLVKAWDDRAVLQEHLKRAMLAD